MSGPWWSARFMKGESCVSRASEQKNSYFHSFLLLMTATIWGVAFVAQSVGMDHVGPITFVDPGAFLFQPSQCAKKCAAAVL